MGLPKEHGRPVTALLEQKSDCCHKHEGMQPQGRFHEQQQRKIEKKITRAERTHRENRLGDSVLKGPIERLKIFSALARGTIP